RPRFVPAHRRWGLRGGRAPAHHSLEGDRRRAREDQVRGDEIMSTTHWDPQAGHLLSPDGKWFWDGAAQKWQQVPSHTDKPDKPERPERPAPPAQPEEKAKPERGLSSFVGTVRSEDLEYGHAVGISVAFPTWLTGAYTTFVVGMYGIVCLVTAPVEDFPAVFTRLLMIAAVAVCGNLFARSESKRRADAIRIHNETLDEIEQKGGNANVKPA